MVLVDDFFAPWTSIHLNSDSSCHIVPRTNESLFDELKLVLQAAAIEPLKVGGVYVQTLGPRFETKAEIRMLQAYGDVVGMTAANEIILFSELEIPVALICMVDNYAHGVKDPPLSLEEFHKGVQKNLTKVASVQLRRAQHSFDRLLRWNPCMVLWPEN